MAKNKKTPSEPAIIFQSHFVIVFLKNNVYICSLIKRLMKTTIKSLFDYIESKYERDYAGVLELLPYAVMDNDKKVDAFELLLDAEKRGKKFKAYYPGFEKLDLSKYDTVGTILDGVLLIEK
jgi:hypothetical protein